MLRRLSRWIMNSSVFGPWPPANSKSFQQKGMTRGYHPKSVTWPSHSGIVRFSCPQHNEFATRMIFLVARHKREINVRVTTHGFIRRERGYCAKARKTATLRTAQVSRRVTMATPGWSPEVEVGRYLVLLDQRAIAQGIGILTRGAGLQMSSTADFVT